MYFRNLLVSGIFYYTFIQANGFKKVVPGKWKNKLQKAIVSQENNGQKRQTNAPDIQETFVNIRGNPFDYQTESFSRQDGGSVRNNAQTFVNEVYPFPSHANNQPEYFTHPDSTFRLNNADETHTLPFSNRDHPVTLNTAGLSAGSFTSPYEAYSSNSAYVQNYEPWRSTYSNNGDSWSNPQTINKPSLVNSKVPTSFNVNPEISCSNGFLGQRNDQCETSLSYNRIPNYSNRDYWNNAGGTGVPNQYLQQGFNSGQVENRQHLSEDDLAALDFAKQVLAERDERLRKEAQQKKDAKEKENALKYAKEVLAERDERVRKEELGKALEFARQHFSNPRKTKKSYKINQGKHVLSKVPGKASQVRTNCDGCYERLSLIHNPTYASRHTNKVITRCDACDQWLCQNCFDEIHHGRGIVPLEQSCQFCHKHLDRNLSSLVDHSLKCEKMIRPDKRHTFYICYSCGTVRSNKFEIKQHIFQNHSGYISS